MGGEGSEQTVTLIKINEWKVIHTIKIKKGLVYFVVVGFDGF